jgi:hypothetical protein
MPHCFAWGSGNVLPHLQPASVHSTWYEEQRRIAGAAPLVVDSRIFLEQAKQAAALGHTTYALTLDWSSLQPTRGAWDAQVADEYLAMVSALRQFDIRPIVLLSSGVQPLWFARLGGWERPEAIGFFMEYVRRAAAFFGDTIDTWLTMYEPLEYIGSLPAGRVARKVRSHMQQAQEVAKRVLEQTLGNVPLGTIDRIQGDGTVPTLAPSAVTIQVWHRSLPRHGALSAKMGVSARDSQLQDAFYDRPASALPLYIISSYDTPDAGVHPALIRSQLRTIEDAQKRGVDIRGYVFTPFFDATSYLPGNSKVAGLAPHIGAHALRAIIASAR